MYVKLIPDILFLIISSFVTASIDLDLSPDCLSYRVTSIYKNGDSKQLSSYRPISVLSCVAIIYERIPALRLTDFFSKHIINKAQFGFQHNHATGHIVLDSVTNIYNRLEKGEIICILLDLKKALDTVDHKILIAKLEHLGILINFTNRQQDVRLPSRGAQVSRLVPILLLANMYMI